MFALQVLPVLETYVRQMCFSQVSVLTVQGGKRKQSLNDVLEMPPFISENGSECLTEHYGHSIRVGVGAVHCPPPVPRL